MSAGIVRAVQPASDEGRSAATPQSAIRCALPGCHNEFIPARRRGDERRYCRAECRRKDWERQHPRQAPLDFTPPPEPLPPVADQRPTPVECEKLRGDNALVLARLRLGPATTLELQAAAPRSMAIHSRVADCRTYLRGQGETITRTCLGPRLHLYLIERA